MRGVLETAGELVGIDAPVRWADRIFDHAFDRALASDAQVLPVPLTVTASQWSSPRSRVDRPLGRGISTTAQGVSFRSAATSGIDLHVGVEGDHVRVDAGWAPPLRDALLNRALPSRARLLGLSVLLHYPALWRASWSNRVPIHAGALVVGGIGVLITGPSGVGKSTLAQRELELGSALVSDNLVVSDGESAWGLVEPMRLASGAGPKTTNGRREVAGVTRVPRTRVDMVVVLRRTAGEPCLRPIPPNTAARELVAATYGAGELRRYWAFAGALALATGRGPIHPSITSTAEALCGRTPCLELDLGEHPGAHLSTFLAKLEVPRWK
jgi:hypothetical protein